MENVNLDFVHLIHQATVTRSRTFGVNRALPGLEFRACGVSGAV